jgi:hypothetical protein
MAQYTHRTPPNQNPPHLSVYDIVYRYRTIYRCNSIRYCIRYQVRYRVRCLIFYYGQGGLLLALDRDAADVNSVNTIPHCFRGKIPREAAADSRPDNGTGSRLFEINMWMWRYGRTFPRQISVDQAVEFRKKRVQQSRARGAETLRRRRDVAWAKGASAPQ